MIKQLSKKIYLLLFLAIMLVFTGTVKAQTSESISSFDSQIQVSKNGQLQVVETIDYFFPGQRHGIFRIIPLSSKVGSSYRNISLHFDSVSRDGNSEPFKVSRSGINEEVKIGDPDQTITGSHEYKIYYTVDNQVGNYNDHDEIYWNVTGNDWPVPIQKASATITSDFGVKITQATCYTGIFGSTTKNCQNSVPDTAINFGTTVPLQTGEGLSVVAGFPADTFPKTTLSDHQVLPLETWKLVLLAIGGVFYYLVLPVGLFVWYKKTHHKSRFGPVSVNFDIPKDQKGDRIPPAEAGAVDTAKLEKNDVIATIFDLAIRKYIKLVDVPKERKFLGIEMDSISHQIKKLRPFTDPGLTEYEKTLMSTLFNDGDTIDIKDLPTDFYVTFKLMQDQVFEKLVIRGLYTDNPTNRINFLTGGVIGVLILGLNIPLAGVLFYFSKVMNGQTDIGGQMDFQIDGLKIFLKNMRREYKWQAKNLVLAERYIPYAIALGYIDEFMEQLRIVYPQYQPGWYSGSGSFYNFYPVYFSSLNSGFATVTPSSSSGFSGGGGSGGGGGGGGGGSW